MKPHKGRLEHWIKRKFDDHTIVLGFFHGHPEFDGRWGHTSYIVSHDEATGEIETRNSRYTLGKPYEEPSDDTHGSKQV